MASNSLFRRASSTVIPLAIRAVGSPRTYHRAISTVLSVEKGSLNRHTFAPFMRFSTAIAKKPKSDESLVSVIQAEIDCADQAKDNILEDRPEDFPFEIEDIPGERTIFLTREYGDEIIKVQVDIPNIPDDVSEEEEEEAEDSELSLPLVVSITKGNGQFLEFAVTAFPDEVSIDSVFIKQSEDSENELAYEAPAYEDLNDKLQNSLHEFLEVRGIDASTAKFLHKYMTNKADNEYLVWLNNLKKFVKK